MSCKKTINVNGSINGIVNLGNNSINLNQENKIIQIDENSSEKSDINKAELKKDKIKSKIMKTVMEIVVGVVISIIAGYILYKLNMN